VYNSGARWSGVLQGNLLMLPEQPRSPIKKPENSTARRFN
jgi:hypothetical protein